MATDGIRLIVITPERQALDATVDAVTLPAHDGELGILRDRAALMCELGIGQLRYRAGGQTKRMYVDGGFAQGLRNEVTVLTKDAVEAENVTPEMIATTEQAANNADADRDLRAKMRRRASVMRSLRAS